VRSRPTFSLQCFFRRLAWVAAVVCAAPLLAVAADYSLREWHPQDGMPSEDAGCVLQDRRGFLWILTIGGLTRFDGAQFEVITPRGEDQQALALNRAMTETPNLGIVVAPVRGGLSAFIHQAWQPVSLPQDVAKRIFISLFTAADGALWAGCDDGLLLRIDRGGTQLFHTRDGMHGRAVFTFATDEDGQLWVANGTSLHRYAAGQLTSPALASNRAELRISSSANGGPWVVTDALLGKITGDQVAAKAALPPLLGAHYIQAMHEDRNGLLWVGTRSQGLFTLNGDRLEHVPTSHEDITSILADPDGSTWVATNGGGLNRLRAKVFALYDKAAGLGDNFTDTICQDRDGVMWFGNRDGGVAFLRDNQITRVANPPEWPILSAVSVAPHPHGGIWNTAGPGLFRIPGSADPVMTAVQLPRLPIIRVTFAARDGSLWLAADPDRIARLRHDQLQIFGPDDGFPPGHLRCIAEDATGRIWCSTAQGNLLRFNGARFEKVSIGLPTGVINAIHFDEQGNPWLGTAQAGLAVRLNGQWRTLDRPQGLLETNITQILSDGRGYLWFGSIRGVYRASERDLLACLQGRSAQVHTVLLGKDEGLKDLSCIGFFQPAAWRSREGWLWFATRKGVLRIDPALTTPEAPAPPVRILEVRVDNQLQPASSRILVSADLHKLEVSFSALCLATPDRVQMRYRLDGFDDNWINATGSRQATYPRLPPGEYVFHVTADLGDGANNGASSTILFVVTPLWWQTWWWRALAFAAAAGLVWLAARSWSHRRLRQKLERLEREQAVERERIRIAQNIHDDIGASLTRISLLTQSVQREDSEHAADLEKIYQAASEITRSLDETVWAVNPKYDDLESLVYYLGNFAQQFLSAGRIRCRLNMPEGLPGRGLTSQARHHIFLCCKEALNNVVKHAAATEVSLSVQASPDFFHIEITDNGRGLGTSRTPAVNRAVTGHGLANIRSRMAQIGGSAVVEPAANGGTTVRLAIPLKSQL
jgi:signal transduction histidine kinase/ligand-binding sensor domain-containing protein